MSNKCGSFASSIKHLNIDMKKTVLFLAALCLSLGMRAADDSDTLTVRVDGMHCDHCAHKVKTLLKKSEGVDKVMTNIERHTVTIAYDPAVVTADTLQARLAATKRYAPAPYSPADVIAAETGLHIDDMHCGKCANRITARLEQVEGVDSIIPHVGKHYVTVKYDANKTSKAVIRQTVLDAGYTPVAHYKSEAASYAYFLLPEDKADDAAADAALLVEGVDDVAVNSRRHAMAVTFDNRKTTADKILAQLVAQGIPAQVPPPHECKEEKK